MSIEAIPDITTYVGGILPGTELVVYEKDDPEHLQTLNGFDEIGLFDHEFKEPRYGFWFSG